MKRILIFLVLGTCLCTIQVSAQAFEISPTYGYQLGTKLNYGPNYLRYDDGSQFGMVLGYETYSDLVAELTFIYQSSQASIRDAFISPQEQFLADVDISWIQLGAKQYFGDDQIMPYAGGGLGLMLVNPSNENQNVVNRSLDNETVFSFHFKGGVQIMFTDAVGLQLQAALLLPVNWGGFVVGVGPGGPSGGVSISSTSVIGAFSGGLIFRLGS